MGGNSGLCCDQDLERFMPLFVGVIAYLLCYYIFYGFFGMDGQNDCCNLYKWSGAGEMDG